MLSRADGRSLGPLDGTNIGSNRYRDISRADVLAKKGRNLVRLDVRSSGAVAFCTPYTVHVLPELCGPEFEPCSSMTLYPIHPQIYQNCTVLLDQSL